MELEAISTAPLCDALWASGQLVLRRVAGNSQPDERWNLLLALHKATIGAGRTCSVRLTEPGVRPLHCVISLGDDGPLVRRWSEGTLLNGQAFVEAPLAVGDRLTVGPVELEVLADVQGALEEVETNSEECEASSAAPAAVAWPPQELAAEEPAAECHAPASEPTNEPASNYPAVQGVTPEAVAATRRQGAERARQLIAALRTARHERNAEIDKCFDLQHQLERKTRLRAELEAELTEAQSLLTGAREELQHQHDAHQTELAALREEVDALQAALVARDAEIAQLQAELAEQAADSSSSHEARETIDPISTDLAPPPAPIETEEVASEPLWSAVPAEPETSNDAELELSAPLAEETSELWGEAAAPEEPSPSADPQEAFPSESLWGEVAAEPTAEAVAEGGWEPAPATPTTESEDLWDVERPAADSPWGVAESPVPEAEPAATDESFDPFAGVASEAPQGFSPAEEESAGEEESLWGETPLPADAPPAEARDQVPSSGPVEPVSEWGSSAPHQETPAGESLWSEDRQEAATALAEEAEEPSNAPFTPPSYIEQFAHLLESEPDEPSSGLAEPMVAPKPATPPAPAADPLADEESIEDYMAKMMSRLRGQSEATAVAGAKSVTIERHHPEAAPTPETPVRATVSEAPKELPLTSLDQLKRAAAPERQANMSLLRDLANSSARHAIGTADVRRARKTAWANLGCSLLAVVSGGYLIWAAPEPLSPQTAGGAVAAIAAGIWGSRTLTSILQAKRDSHLSSLHDDSSEASEQLPIDVS